MLSLSSSPPVRLRWPVEMLATLIVGVAAGGFATALLGGRFTRVAFGLVAVAVVALVVTVAWRRPDLGLVALVSLMPFSDLLLATLHRLGVSVSLVSAARSWKELVIAVVVVRVAWLRPRWDGLDRLIFGFIGLVLVYVVLPIGPPIGVRLLAARQDAIFLILFLCARALASRARVFNRLEVGVLVAGTIVAGFTVWNAFAPDAFAQWIEFSGLQQYRTAVLGTPPTPVVIFRPGGEVMRAGSLFLSATTLAFYLVVPLGLAIGRLVRNRFHAWHVLAGAAAGLGLMLTLTRSAIGAVPLMVVLAWLVGRRRGRLWIVIGVAMIVFAPLAGSIGVGAELRTSFDPENESRASHILRLKQSSERVAAHPLGTGLGTAGSISRRFSVDSSITNENWYFQVGTAMGIPAMVLFVVIVWRTLRELWRHAREGHSDAVGPLAALAAISVGAIVLLTLEDFSVAWSVWALAGAALGAGAWRNDESVTEGGPPARQPVSSVAA